MATYKVTFENNVPSRAIEITGESHKSLKEFSDADGEVKLDWLIVQANSEPQAIQIADKLVSNIWGDILHYMGNRKKTA